MNDFKPSKRYFDALGALYGSGKVAQRQKRVKKPTSAAEPTEYAEQCKFVNWLRERDFPHYAIPNGRKNAIEGHHFKNMGAVAGIPDLCLPIPTAIFHGLYIEMKRRTGGVLSAEQKRWIKYFQRVGYCAKVANGCDEAIAILKKYLDDGDNSRMLVSRCCGEMLHVEHSHYVCEKCGRACDARFVMELEDYGQSNCSEVASEY